MEPFWGDLVIDRRSEVGEVMDLTKLPSRFSTNLYGELLNGDWGVTRPTRRSASILLLVVGGSDSAYRFDRVIVF